MLTVRILPADEVGITEAVRVLRKGGIVAHATETCYGLACDLSNQKAVAHLFAVKQRPETQPVSALFRSVEQAKEFVEWNEKAQKLADAHLPGPLTLILPLSAALYPTPMGGETLGVRVSSHPVAQALVTAFGAPISTTSANMHGKPPIYSVGELKAQGIQPDLVLNSGTLPPTPPSTILDLSTETVRKLRN